MAESSFDIEANVDRQEVDNAINQAAREVSTRYDFKGTDTVVEWSGEGIRVESSTEERANAALDVLQSKFVKRKVSLKAMATSDPQEVGGGRSRIDISLRTTLDKELAKEIVKQVKASKLKVGVTNMGDKVRVSSKSRDTLQEIIALVKAQDYDAPLVFTNYK